MCEAKTGLLNRNTVIYIWILSSSLLSIHKKRKEEKESGEGKTAFYILQMQKLDFKQDYKKINFFDFFDFSAKNPRITTTKDVHYIVQTKSFLKII